MFDDDSPFAERPEKRALRLVGVLGPFLHIHRKLIKEAYDQRKITILHSPLSCFIIKFRLALGEDELAEYTMSPTDLKGTASDFHQLLLFSYPVEVPEQFFILDDFNVVITLTHKLEDFDSVFVARGKVNHLFGDVIFTLSDGKDTKVDRAIITDLLKHHINDLSIPLYRSPSPMLSDIASQSVDLFSGLAQMETTMPYVGDLEKYSGTVTNTFACIVTSPAQGISAQELDWTKFRRPRFFKDNSTPTYDKVPHLKQIINCPFISGMTDADFEALKEYPKYVSTFPSGFLKLASRDMFVSSPDLPFSIALYTLTLEDPTQYICRHATNCLYRAPLNVVKTFIPCVVQVAIISKEAKDFLLDKCAEDDEICVSTYWNLMLESENKAQGSMAQRILADLLKVVNKEIIADIEVGRKELDRLMEIVKGVKTVPKDSQINFLKEKLGDGHVSKPFRLPIMPSFIVHSISLENIIVFGSSLQPVKFDFLNDKKQVYSAILKYGDDMRQDALALNTIKFIDDHLKGYGLDLCMSPYKVLPISKVFGMMEFIVGAKAVSKVLEQNNDSISEFWDKSEGDMPRQRFIKSSAAYSVVSYVLGVGDRHLDNLLVSKKGNFLHVDFGYMFGIDPKFVPVTVRVVEQMTNAMGPDGTNEFLRLCSVVFVAVRHIADELCCSLAMMMKADLPHLPKSAAVLSKTMLQKLALDMSDEGAGDLIRQEVIDAITALRPMFAEYIHRFVQKL
ncbi:Phosphatidylinositol 3- and 4-kinase family protein [Trichomonas vaginalis G3]|uniref:Phosphatidylinositol 3-and 4-kinase family protein n=1 Tax=Trichomonas vaginalis (strain ATCC PRA-98 / G3) TaxID=412133 RepID=A2EAP0_TRIV3|nr:1-phosphatidylinositol-3-kinase protein [Trichomonas vaginalis G3]EAY10243.1 Phosphatidylinositol 3- and 4-kinase family protein [Trichomonas vaginalis G3]KAI5487725.1 1-phosphatidylinositol-3-kinase protein [Trichomonas vaginalis G3]|eukprot:XP_001322466.1 Phosphatidylinositol 3- and 4-kinase family protein [Trichomonas vaginalis G3]